MRTSLLALLLAFQALALPTTVVHEKRSILPSSKFTLHKRAPEDRIIPLRIYLKQSNIHRLEEQLYDVSDPYSKNYGKHWSPEDIKSFFLPSVETHDAVRQWLSSELEETQVIEAPSGSHFTVHLPVSEAERLLDTQYNIFKYIDGTEHVGELYI